MAKFDKRFEGASNAGLRKQIRDAVSGHRCGPANERAVLALGRVVALTAQGQHTLTLVAGDYRHSRGEYEPTCDCDACYAGNSQRLGAIG